MLQIESIALPPVGTNAYLVTRKGSDEALLVDAPLQAWTWAQDQAGLTDKRIVACLMTHGHWDHTLGGHAVNAAGVPVYGHPDDRTLFEQPSVMSDFSLPGLTMRPMQVDHWVTPADELEFLGLRCELRHVPGHCPGSLLFWFPEARVAFVGDAIFAGSIGRTDLPLGDHAVLERSIREQIYTLPPETVLYPGHGPETTVAREAVSNPFVRAE